MEYLVAIIVAVITGGLSLAGVIITTNANNKDLTHKIETSQAVTDTKVQNLADEVKRHYEYIEKIPKMEVRIDNLEEDVKELKKR